MLLIDGNNIAHANHHATKLSVGGFQTQAIFGTLNSMHRLLTDHYPGFRPLVLWDGRCQWRRDLFPEYKGNRDPALMKPEKVADDQARQAQMPYIFKMLSLLGVKQVRGTTAEADDLAGVFARKLSAMCQTTVMVSGDQDWLCLVDENVMWFDPIRHHKVGLGNFLDFTGFFSTEEFVQGLALTGDASDNINGIPGMGEKTASKFLAEHRSVEDFLRKVDDGSYKPKSRKSSAKSLHPEQIIASPEGRELFARNLKLVDLRGVPTPPSNELEIDPGSYNEDAFRALCERLSFASILREWDQFLKPFRALQHQ